MYSSCQVVSFALAVAFLSGRFGWPPLLDASNGVPNALNESASPLAHVADHAIMN
jgi:hypothetical protein